MLTTKEIVKLTNKAFYARGRDIYESGGVDHFSAEEIGDGIWYISADVLGSGYRYYRVELEYDDDQDELTSCFCECPAFYQYDDLCKHCVAVLLCFVDFIEEHPILFLRKRRQEGERLALADQPVTTPAMQGLLMKNFMQQTYPIVYKDIYKKVRLDAYLEYSERTAKVEFRIGISKMYVLKDIFGFVKNMQEAAEYAYGKQLQFIHMKEAFTENAGKMVEFILHWAQKNAGRFEEYAYYGFYHAQSYRKIRDLDLDDIELEELLCATGGEEFYVNYCGSGERKWRVADEELGNDVTITGEENGIHVALDYVYDFLGEKYYWYFLDGLIYMVERKRLEPVRDFLDCMSQIPERKAFIRKEDVPVFCRQILPQLERFYGCQKIGLDVTAYLPAVAVFEIYLDVPQKDLITCKAFVRYDEDKYALFGKEEEKKQSARDFFREIEVGDLVSSYFNAYDEKEGMMALSGDEDKLYELLAYGIPCMQEIGEVYVSDALKRLRLLPSPAVSVGISLAGDMLELTMSSDDMPMGQLIEVLSKYDRRKKYFRLKNGCFVDASGEGLEALARMKDELGITDRQLKKEQITLPKYRAFYLDEELVQQSAFGVTQDKGFREWIQGMKSCADTGSEVPASLEEIMREYQKKGFQWIKMLKNHGIGGILADDMGLGKTLQVIAFLLSEYIDARPNENKRCIIITPASLVFNWSSEIERFAPALHVVTVTGNAAERQKVIRSSGERDILLTSYDLLRRDIDYYVGIHFYCQIIDEAQYIKNHNTQVARAVKEMEAGFRLALTGTPVENRLSELWSIFDFLMPGFLYSYQHFRESIEIPIVQNGNEEAMRRLRKLINPFVLRRLKKDVLADLPDKIEENVYAKLEGEQQKLYDAHVQRMRMMLDKTSEEEFKTAKIQILAELTKLRQICCEPALIFEGYAENSAKAQMCMDLVRNAINGGHKILLFSQFTSMLDHIGKALDKEGIRYFMLTGATPKEKRIQMVEDFNHDDTPVFCISLKAGGTGLNLTAADIVIHYDPWWNLAVENQATDRAHRIGQENVVNVYKLIVKGTIEDNIVKLQERKRELAEQVLGGDGMGGASFTKEELLELLQY